MQEQGIKEQAEIIKENVQTINDFISKPENKEQALLLANDILNVMGHRWFNIRKMSTKLNIQPKSCLQKLEVLKMFELVMNKKEVSGIDIYHIDIDKNQRKRLMEAEIHSYELKIQLLRKGLEDLK